VDDYACHGVVDRPEDVAMNAPVRLDELVGLLEEECDSVVGRFVAMANENYFPGHLALHGGLRKWP
jgi:hypothetical protein